MRLKIVGNDPRANGSECVIFGHVKARSHAFTSIRGDLRTGAESEFAAFGRWDVRPMRVGPGPQTALAMVGTSDGDHYCRTTGRLVVLSHSWSGRLQINNVDRKYIVDLYSEETRLVLLDLIAEVMIDLSALASFENSVIRLPDLTRDTIMHAVVDHRVWFRFLEPDVDFEPGLPRRILGWRQPRTDSFKLQIVSRLLPELTRPAPTTPSPGDAALHDEMRLLAAAVEGLALRAPVEA